MLKLTDDPTVDMVLDAMIKRSKAGMSKYGKAIRDDARNDLVGWINEVQEELGDAMVYLEKVKEVLRGVGNVKESDAGTGT